MSISLIVTIFAISLQFPIVQTFVTKKVTTFLSKELGSKIEVGAVYFKPFSSITLHEVEIYDKNGKLIAGGKRIAANLSLRKIFENKLLIREIGLNEIMVDFERYQDSTNFKFLIDYFSTPQKKGKKTQSLDVEFGQVTFANCHFKYQDKTKKPIAVGVDYANIELTQFSGALTNIEYDSTYAKVDINNLMFKEKSGFYLQNLTAATEITSKSMVFNDLTLQTNRSVLKDYLEFSFSKFGDFEDFLHKVEITSNIKDSYVDSKDIEYFAPTMSKVVFTSKIDRADIFGTVSNIRARNVEMKTKENTRMLGSFGIKGLPDIDKTIFDFRRISLVSSIAEIEQLVPELSNNPSFKLPEQLHPFADISFIGDFVGKYNDFVVDGDFSTGVGKFQTRSDINIVNGIRYKGTLISNALNIGEIIKSPSLGNTGVNLTFSGQEFDLDLMKLDFDGELSNFQFNQNNLRYLRLSGDIDAKKLNLAGNVDDTKALLDFETDIDWNGDQPVYTLSSEIENLDLKTLGFIKKDSLVIYNTHLLTNLQGDNVNNLNGFLTADSIHLKTLEGSYSIANFDFEASGNEQNRTLTLTSNVADIEMAGIIDLNTIPAYFRSLAMEYAPAIGLEREPFNDQNFDLKVNVKAFNPISSLIDPELELDDGAYLNANFSSDDYKGNFVFFSPTFKYKGIRLRNLQINENADENRFSLDLNADSLFLSDSVFFRNIAIRNELADDQLKFKINVSDDTATNYVRLNGDMFFEHAKPAFVNLDSSKIVLSGEEWLFNDNAELKVSKGKFYFDNFTLASNDQSIDFKGVASNESDVLSVNFNNFGLQSLEAVTKPLGIDLRGEMNGNIDVTSVFKSPFFKAKISTTPLVYNNLPIGQLQFLADYNPSSDLVDVDLQLQDELRRGIKVAGTYDLNNSENSLRLRGTLNEMELVVFAPFLRSIVKDVSGKTRGEFTLSGNFRNPIISGNAEFEATEFTVNYLNTRYRIIDQSILVENNKIALDHAKILDIENHEALASGTVDLGYLLDPTIEIEVNAQKFQVLNTTFKDNNLYYGVAFATGTFKFSGETSSLNIDISAMSNENTVITIPFNSAMTISDSDFIYFVDPNETNEKQQANPTFLKGLTMNMDLLINPNAEINLQTDFGALKANGSGEISLNISSLGDFEMFGAYNINSGKFHFTAQDFINKFFDLKPGGTIRWTGNPTDANVELTAIYQQRTSIGALYNAAGRAGQDERVVAQADMIISGTLSQPDISFDLNFPLTPYVKDELQAYLSDANNVNQQALSLIVRRSFTAASSENAIGREVNNTLLSAGTEIAFNQLNNIISQSLNVNFLDLNIRSLNDASASLRLFDDRLVLTGGISDRRNLQTTDLTFFSNKIATDAEVTYRIRRDGNLMFRAYNRLNTRNILFTPTDEYINAVGLVYRQEFNTFSEFFKRLMTFKRREPHVSSTTTEINSTTAN